MGCKHWSMLMPFTISILGACVMCYNMRDLYRCFFAVCCIPVLPDGWVFGTGWLVWFGFTSDQWTIFVSVEIHVYHQYLYCFQSSPCRERPCISLKARVVFFGFQELRGWQQKQIRLRFVFILIYNYIVINLGSNLKVEIQCHIFGCHETLVSARWLFSSLHWSFV